MCGRYTLIRHDTIVGISFNLTVLANLRLIARYNIAPTQEILAFARRPELTPQLMRWGLVPSWATDLSIGNRMINARAETLAQKPAFRKALEARRCIIPADGFYEWRKNPDGSKTPFYIQLKSQAPFAFSGLYENWNTPDGQLITSCTIITTTANAVIGPIHDRMPVILSASAVPQWLNPQPQSPADLSCVLIPYDAEEMTVHPVSRRVNSAAANTPDLIEPVLETDSVTSPSMTKSAGRTKPPDPHQGSLF